MVYFTCYCSVYQPAHTCHWLRFTQNIPAYEILRQVILISCHNILTNTVLLFPVYFIPSSFHHIYHHQPLFCCLLWLLGWGTQSGNILYGTHIPLLWAFWIPNAIVSLYIGFNVCLSIIYNFIWIIQVSIPVKPILSIRNCFGFTLLISLAGVTVNSFDWVDICSFSFSSRGVCCRPSWWQ